MTFKKNLELAQRVLKEIQATVTTSNSIIPGTELPMILEDYMPSYVAKFGALKMQEMMDYQKYLSIVRDKSRLIVEYKRLEKEGKIAPLTTLYVAITMMGVGECADTSNLAAILFCQKGCESFVNVILLEGRKPNGEVFEHALVVIGNCEKIGPVGSVGIESFRLLGDECVLIDPLIGVVGKANQLESLADEMKYLKTFSMKCIQDITTMYPLKQKKQADEIYANAKALSQQWCKTIEPYKRKSSQGTVTEAKSMGAASVASASSAVLPPRSGLGLFDSHTTSDPHLKLLEQLKSIKLDSSTKTAFDSIDRKNYAQAVRRICTVNSEVSNRMLTILLRFKDEFSINIDEPAGDKKQTALHQAAAHTNQFAYDLLIASGANATIQDAEGRRAMDYFPVSSVSAAL